MKAFIVLFALVAAAYADAEAEADPYLLYGGYGGWGGWTGYAGLPYGAYGYAAPGTVGYGPAHLPHTLTAAVKSVEVQPATVEVKAVAPVVHAAPYFAPAVAAHHVVAAAPAVAAPVLAGVPCTNALGQAVPCALGHPAVKTAAVPHVIAKRDAEAEADPAYFYNGYGGYAGWGYAGYGLPHAYAGYHHAGYPYGAYHGYAPSDPTAPHLLHTSRVGICTNYLGARVPC
jgi:hypothetical protein